MQALVTVGIPTFNNAPTLRQAVESVLAQTYPGVQIVVSDNCSTDGTAEIGRSLAAEHDRVRYLRQPTNLGNYGNFRAVLRQATTPYFMWLGGDDVIDPSFVARTVAVLEADPGVASCTSRVLLIRENGERIPASGTYPLAGDAVGNLARYLSDPNENSRMFGLHRTRILQRAFPHRGNFIAFDWAVMAGLLLGGRTAEIPEVLMVRDETPHCAHMDRIRRQPGFFLWRWFPVLPLTSDLIFRQRIPLRLPVIKALLFLNLTMHLQYIQTFHPGYRKLEIFLERHLLWRLKAAPADPGGGWTPGLREGAGSPDRGGVAPLSCSRSGK